MKEGRISPRGRGGARRGQLFGGGGRTLEDAHKSVQGDGEMGDADRLCDDQDYRAVHMVAGRVDAVGFVGADVEVVEGPAHGSQGQETGEERAAGGRPVFL